MKQLYVMVGIPGSGKSTYLKNHLTPDEMTMYVVSRDNVRFKMIKPGDAYFSKENDVFNQYVLEVQCTLDTYGICYADATHLNEKSRNKLLDRLNLVGTEIHMIVMETGLADCLTRNAERDGLAQVPASAVKRMAYSMTNPSMDKKYTYASIRRVI